MTLGKSVGDQGPLRTQVQFYTKMVAWEMFRGIEWNEKSFCFLPRRSWLPLHCDWSKRWNVVSWAGAGPGDITCLRFLLLNHSEWKKIQRHPESGLQGARNVKENAFGLLLGALAAV